MTTLATGCRIYRNGPACLLTMMLDDALFALVSKILRADIVAKIQEWGSFYFTAFSPNGLDFYEFENRRIGQGSSDTLDHILVVFDRIVSGETIETPLLIKENTLEVMNPSCTAALEVYTGVTSEETTTLMNQMITCQRMIKLPPLIPRDIYSLHELADHSHLWVCNFFPHKQEATNVADAYALMGSPLQRFSLQRVIWTRNGHAEVTFALNPPPPVKWASLVFDGNDTDDVPEYRTANLHPPRRMKHVANPEEMIMSFNTPGMIVNANHLAEATCLAMPLIKLCLEFLYYRPSKAG